MNKNVFNYLNDKTQELTDYIKAKAESVGNYLSEHAQDIKQGAIKGTATALTLATLLGGTTGCVMQGRPVQGTPQPGTQQTQPVDPNEPSRSDGGHFWGERYTEDDLPAKIEHRTEEEIAQTGLTAQDVLNAYDQLAIDIAIAYYSSELYNGALSEEAKNNITATFESLTPQAHPYLDEKTQEENVIIAPFYALDKEFLPRQFWQDLKFNTIPAYITTLNLQVYVDGVTFAQRIETLGVEQQAFEKMLSTFNKETFYLDNNFLLTKVDKSKIGYFRKYLYQNVYEPLDIARDTIQNASPKQLEAIYQMLTSIRSITFDRTLPNASTNDVEMGE